jgi:hypothetical protein
VQKGSAREKSVIVNYRSGSIVALVVHSSHWQHPLRALRTCSLLEPIPLNFDSRTDASRTNVLSTNLETYRHQIYILVRRMVHWLKRDLLVPETALAPRQWGSVLAVPAPPGRGGPAAPTASTRRLFPLWY